MSLPNFLIVGAAKAGTTSLYSYLGQHPEIYMSPKKEPRYFAPEYYTTFYRNALGNQHRPKGMLLKEYESLFDGVTNEVAIGEASTEYLLFEKSAARIKAMIPDAKIIIVLRNPIDRAFSAYCYHLRDGRETLSFKESLEHEPIRAKKKWQVGWFYKQGGLYYEQVKRYYEQFDPGQIKLILWKDLNKNTPEVCADIFDFLQVDCNFVPDLSRANRSLAPRSKFLNRYLFKNPTLKRWIRSPLPKPLYNSMTRPLKKLFYTEKEAIKPEVRKQLEGVYRDDINKLEDLTSIDLSHWKG